MKGVGTSVESVESMAVDSHWHARLDRFPARYVSTAPNMFGHVLRDGNRRDGIPLPRANDRL